LDSRGLDSRGVLEGLVARRRVADRAEAELLALVVRFVDLHPPVDPDAAASMDLDRPLARSGGRDPGPGRVGLGGPGTPGIDSDAAVELAAVLGVSYRAVLGLLAESVELCHRLPRLWALVQAGVLQGWKARRVAQHTTGLSSAAVGFVDQHLAVTGRHNRIPANLPALVHWVLTRFDPELADGHEEAALAARHVSFSYHGATSNATADLTATLDLLDALDLDHRVTTMATAMARLGDTSTLGVRRAHALGMLANPQHTLTIFGAHPDNQATDQPPENPATDQPTDQPTNQPTGTGASGGPTGGPTGGAAGLAETAVRGTHTGTGTGTGRGAGTGTGCCPGSGCRSNSVGATLYLHITSADLAAAGADPGRPDTSTDPGGSEAGTGTGGTGATVERLGSVTLRLLRDWLHRSSRVTIRPVLDPARTDRLDRHDPPGWMREAVILRDQTCVFPGCTIDARTCDLDHITPWRDPDHGGPPGQTSISNLACLCRRHHRAKTHTAWTYHRTPTGDYQWTSPHGHRLTSPHPRH
ncbi:MAG TPA: hypothetical protein VFQ11_08595, partial [Nocardioidaceae bacterium]|nr:hypothetical protein [Nocardioidaceae bacterium]